MEFIDFYLIAEYGNENWKGNFMPYEVACFAYDYLLEFEESKKGKVTHTIQELLRLLTEDGSKKCREWINQITSELTERSD